MQEIPTATAETMEMEVSPAKTKIPTATAETMEMEGPHRTRAGTHAAVTAAKLVPTAAFGAETPTTPGSVAWSP